MPHKPSPEWIFKSHYPTARIERQKGNDGSVYYLVRRYDETPPYPNHTYDGSGDTKAQAWKAACESRGLTDLKTKDTP